MKLYISENYKRYIHSCVVTFFTFFCAMLLFELKSHSFQDFEVAGFAGLYATVLRLVFKAVYESLIILIPKVLGKLK